MKNVRYSLVYKFFVSQICFGYYRKGDTLPSIDELAKKYHATSKTVYNAYKQLQADGFITLSSGRKTTVVYEATPEEYTENYLDYYMARKDACIALNEAITALLLPLMREGCRRLSHKDMRHIKESAAMLENGDYYISFFCGRTMLIALKNRLALNFFNDTVCFFQFPHTMLRRQGSTQDRNRTHALAEEIMAACDRGDAEALYPLYLDVSIFMDQLLRSDMKQMETGRPVQKQIPFDWKLYRDHPQRCYSVAARLISQLYIHHTYAPGDSLPYYGELAKAFSVSFSTIRRTMELMEKLGAVVTAQGVRTKVVDPKPKPGRFQDPIMKRVLNTLREIMQILSISFDSIVEHAPPWNDGELRACSAQFQNCAKTDGIAAFAMGVDFIFERQTCFHGIWEKLYEGLLLGLPLVKAEVAPNDRLISSTAPQLIGSLEAGDVPAFYAALKQLTIHIAQIMEAVPIPTYSMQNE